MEKPALAVTFMLFALLQQSTYTEALGFLCLPIAFDFRVPTNTGRIMTPNSMSSRELAMLLIAHEAPSGVAADTDVTPVANALRLVASELSNWVGPDGCSALLVRAFTRASQDHPALSTIEIVNHSAPTLSGIEQSVQDNGAVAVIAGLTMTIVELFEMLARVIGTDLTARLAEQITADPTSGATRRDDEEGKH